MLNPETEKDSRPLFTRAFGLRIALWYSTLFILGAIAIVVLTYVLTATSLAQRDRQLINQKLGDYAAAYRRGGLSQLADTVSAEQRTAPERLFVRVVQRGRVESRAARDRIAASRGRDAGAGRKEHRGARRVARAIPRGARHRHALD